MKNIIGLFLLMSLIASCNKENSTPDPVVKLYGDIYEDIGYTVARWDNGYVIGGQLTVVIRPTDHIVDKTLSENNKKLAIIKTGTDGNVIWKKTFGGRYTGAGSKVIVLNDGSIVCTGYVTDTVTLTKDIFVAKTDADGNSLAEKVYKSTGNQAGIDILKTSEGFLVLGSTDVERLPVTDTTGNASGKKDFLLMRINNNLDPIDIPLIKGYPGNDIGVAIKPDLSGGFIVVGTTDRSELRTEQAGNNIIFLRVNSLGTNFTKTRIIGKVDDEYAADIEVTSDGYIVPVTIGSEGTNQRGYILKVPANLYSAATFGADIVFDQSYNISSYSFKAISKYKSNSFVVGGLTGSTTAAKMLLFAVDADGNYTVGKEKITGGTGAQIVYDVTTDLEDNIIAVGKNTYESNSLITLLKFKF
jgi:hypothetical protein